MRHRIVAAAVCTALLLGGWSFAVAEEQAQSAPGVAEKAAPDAAPNGAVEEPGGCMPGGGCCGACKAAKAAQAKASGAPAEAAGGGCPCGRNKQKKSM